MPTPLASSRRLRSGSLKKDQPIQTAQKLFNLILHTISTAHEYQEPIYNDVDPSIGFEVAFSLANDADVERLRPRFHYNSVTRVFRVRIGPTEILECHHRWLLIEYTRMVHSNWLTLAESNVLELSSGLEFENFQAPYTLSFKTPDWFCRTDINILPRIVVESSWKEHLPRLHEDVALWITGGSPEVQIVLIFSWEKMSEGMVKGDLEVWHRDTLGNATLQQSEQIFPKPSPNAAQTVTITRGHLFGEAILPDRNANDEWRLDLSRLRPLAEEKLLKMGLTPASCVAQTKL